jgi:hypothetical protein
MGGSFSMIGFTKADDTYPALGFTKHQRMQPVIQITQSHKARFRVSRARVLPNFRGFKIEINRALKAQTTFCDVFGILGGVELDFHRLIVVTNNNLGKHFVTTSVLIYAERIIQPAPNV